MLLSCTQPADEGLPTAPNDVPLATDPIVVAAGDIAGCDHEGDLLTAALIETIPEATVLTLGDNAYESGILADYTNCYDPGWGRFKARTRPALGNHEYSSGNANGSFDYFGADAFGNSRPNGYYSFDLGAWHIVVLNDNPPKVPIGAGSAQYKWLRADLTANRKACILAVWHQPRFYSTYSGAPGLVSSRKPLWQLLYSARADLLLNGHHHVYERHAPQDPDGRAAADGVRQIIVGTGGFDTWATPTVLSPNVEVIHGGNQVFGVIKVTLSSDGYAWEFLPVGNHTFTDAGAESCRPSGASAARSAASWPAPVAGKATVVTLKAVDERGVALLTGGDAFTVQVSGANSAAPVVTDKGNGVYSARYTPIRVGTDDIAIQVNGMPLAGSPFPSTVSPKVIKSGASRFTQTAPAGSPVPAPPAVKVTDGAGLALAGIEVSFTVAAGGGTIAPASRLTNSRGVATADQWTLGPEPGSNQVIAAVSPASSVAFATTGR